MKELFSESFIQLIQDLDFGASSGITGFQDLIVTMAYVGFLGHLLLGKTKLFPQFLKLDR